MKTIKILPIILSALLAVLTGCYKEYIEPGIMTTEKRSVGNFTGISVSDAMQVYITQGDTEEIEIKAYSGYLPHIITERRNGVLYVYFDRTLSRQHRVYKHEQKVYITLPSLTKIEASGATDVEGLNTFDTENLSISLSGASELNLSLNATNIYYCNLSGSSEATLTGNAVSIDDANVSGASVLKAFDLQVQSVLINVSGASLAEVNVSEELDATASGASKIKYMGNPSVIRQHISGASKIVKF
jgi:hypothetical protein